MTNIDDYDWDIDLNSQVEQTKEHFKWIDEMIIKSSKEKQMIERAIESTKNRIHYLYESSKNGSPNHRVKAEKQEEVQNYILSLIEKEKAKSPVIHTENEFTDLDGNRGLKVTYVECPNCGAEIDELNGLPRCIECGQRIDWN